MKQLTESEKETAKLFEQNFNKAAAGEFFKSNEIFEFFAAALPPETQIIKARKKEYFNVPCSFDIETTSFYRERTKAAIMYIWMFSINGAVIVGRTWGEFETLIYALSAHLNLSADRRLICYIENMAFEFQFMKNRFKWPELFAMELRRPVKALCEYGIEFRCAQYLSGTSLAGIAKSLTLYPVKKLSGDLDYSLMRHSETPITPQEMQYCINDVLVLQSYIFEKIQNDGGINKIPLTKTGYVRHLCRDNCLYDNGNHKTYTAGKKYTRYRALMNQLTTTSTEYEQHKRVYQGGFTHGNSFFTDRTIDGDIVSKDFTSSYPFHLIAYKYPMTAGEDYTPVDLQDFQKQLQYYYCVFDVEFTDIEATFYYDHYISKSKCLDIRGETVDNGRVVCAKYLITSISSDDFKIIAVTYKWKHFTIYNFRRYRLYYLPTDFIKTVVDLYKKKTTLKGVAGFEREYVAAKENLNSLYGMCVTDICRAEIEYKNNVWRQNSANIEKCIDDYNKSKTRFTSYLWGIRCTSAARMSLWRAILECKEDYIYSDTDSIKLLNYEKHRPFFERYNQEVIYLLKLACNHHGISIDDVMPYTKDGKQKIIGVWDDDGEYTKMKFLGAKRYLLQDRDGGLHLTVAGLHKQNAVKYLKQKYKTNVKVFNAFTNDLFIPSEIAIDENGNIIDDTKLDPNAKFTIEHPAGKNTHTYVDEEIDGYLTDYTGRKAHYHEVSFVHLEPTEYNLSLASEYLNFFKRMQSEYL